VLRLDGDEGTDGSADGDLRFVGSGGIEGGGGTTGAGLAAGEGGTTGAVASRGAGGNKLGGPPSSGACTGARNGLPVATAALVSVPFEEARSSGSGAAPE
jgi:hypothetical protein